MLWPESIEGVILLLLEAHRLTPNTCLSPALNPGTRADLHPVTLPTPLHPAPGHHPLLLRHHHRHSYPQDRTDNLPRTLYPHPRLTGRRLDSQEG